MDAVYKIAITLTVLTILTSLPVQGKHRCNVSLRLNTTTGIIQKNIPDYEVTSFLSSCATTRKECPANVLQHVKNIFGNQGSLSRGEGARKLCELFGKELLPRHKGKVDVFYKSSNCGVKGYEHVGDLCCFRCRAGPYTFYHPINYCNPTRRPSWCFGSRGTPRRTPACPTSQGTTSRPTERTPAGNHLFWDLPLRK